MSVEYPKLKTENAKLRQQANELKEDNALLLDALITINEMCADASSIEGGKLNIGNVAEISIKAIQKAQHPSGGKA